MSPEIRTTTCRKVSGKPNIGSGNVRIFSTTRIAGLCSADGSGSSRSASRKYAVGNSTITNAPK